MNEDILINFINQMHLLTIKFTDYIAMMPFPYNTISVQPEQSELIVDVFDYNSPRLHFEKPIFQSKEFPGKSLSFDADSMNAPFGKLWLNAPEGNLELAMAVNDLTLYENNWYYFPPININGPTTANSTLIDGHFIETVIKAAFTPERLEN
jgi:hypothetical protein